MSNHNIRKTWPVEESLSFENRSETISYGRGRFRCDLERDNDYYAIGFQVGKEKQASRLIQQIPGQAKKIHPTVFLVEVPSKIRDQIRSKIRTQLGDVVCFFTPLLVNRLSKQKQILTNEIIVRFKDGVSDELARLLVAQARGTIAKRTENYSPCEYRILVPDPTEFGPLDTLRAFEGTENVEYACPNAMIEVEQVE